jgi:hypothetical protein
MSDVMTGAFVIEVRSDDRLRYFELAPIPHHSVRSS